MWCKFGHVTPQILGSTNPSYSTEWTARAPVMTPEASAPAGDATPAVEPEAALKPPYRGTSLIRNRRPLGPYRRTMPRALWGSQGGGRFLLSEVPL